MQLLQSIRSKVRAAGPLAALLVLGGALFLARSAGAAAPANDTCAGAVVIPSTSFPYLTPVLTNIHESTLDGDPTPNTNCAIGAVRGVWYSFTPNQSGHYTFST